MKVVIYLTAPKDFGKTTIIRTIYEKISGNKPPKGGDFSIICQYRNHTIGFCSWGDPGSPQEEKLKDLQSCDIVICASRTRGTTIAIIDKIFPKYKKFGFIPNYQDSENNAKIICGIINTLID